MIALHGSVVTVNSRIKGISSVLARQATAGNPKQQVGTQSRYVSVDIAFTVSASRDKCALAALISSSWLRSCSFERTPCTKSDALDKNEN